jgi:DNA-binding CsgD family transcriptional regulator
VRAAAPHSQPALVGRARELETIDAALAASRAGSPGACLALAGTLGLGKSRLLREVEARADGRLVLAGQGSEWEAGIPYGVVADALDGYLTALPAPDLARVAEGLAGDLAPALPTLAAGLGAASGPVVEAERYRTHRALRTLIARLAERRPVVLALDDLHWADGETAELVAHLIRHPARGTLLAIAFRPAQLHGALLAALDRARRDGRCEMLELRPLSPGESEELLGTWLEPEAHPEVMRESGGNPYFLEQLARGAAARPAGQGAPRSGAEAEVPVAVMAAIESELSSLDPRERRLLAGGAVAGEPFEIDLAAAAAGVDEAASLPALDALLAAGLVQVTDAPRRFRFRHPVVRRAVYQAAGAGWRLEAHGRVAAALRARGAQLAHVAEHVELSARPGDADAVATLLEAGGEAARRAPATAARLFQAALHLLPAGDRERRLEVLVSLATSLGAAGRLDEARETLYEVLGELPAGAHELRARAATFVARLDHALGRQGEARALLERTLAELPEPRSPEGATLMLELVMDHLLTADFEPMRVRADATLELARELGDPLLEAAALAGVAHAAQNRRDIPASIEAAERAGAILDRLDDAACAPLLETFWWLAAAEDVLERWEPCLRHADRGIRLARRFGVSFVFVALTHTLAVTLGWQGQAARAREAAEATVDASHLSGNPTSLTYAYTARCFVHAQAGETREAVEAGERAVETGRALRRGLFSALPHANLGAALLEDGQPERARAQLLEAEARGALEHWVGRCWWEIWMSGAELELGRIEEAERCARAALATAEEMGLDGRRGSALAALAAVELAAEERGAADAPRRAADAPRRAADAPGREGGPPPEPGGAARTALEAAALLDGAARTALEAAALLDGAGRRSDAAQARILAGRALVAAGQRDRAVLELEHARAALTEAGAPRLADRAARELRRLGLRVARPSRRPGTGAAAGLLSDRERELARLVAAGLTNREIAAELHLSEKTVANHLTRIFSKLEISSRSALAAAVGRADAA